MVDKKDGKKTLAGHHKPLAKSSPRGPSPQEKALWGRADCLDQYVALLKKRKKGRAAWQLRTLLNLYRTYPREPFLKALSTALHYGLFDPARLEQIILTNIDDDFFDLDDDDENGNP